jgi:hypothetical protein
MDFVIERRDWGLAIEPTTPALGEDFWKRKERRLQALVVIASC